MKKNIKKTKSNSMTVIACYPEKTAQVLEIMGGLKGMQEFVGGFIEAIYPFNDPVAIVCNQDGKLNGMERNRALLTEDGMVFDIVAGPMFICGLGEEDFTSLTGKLLVKYWDKFRHPEVFVLEGNHLMIMQVPEDDEMYEGGV